MCPGFATEKLMTAYRLIYVFLRELFMALWFTAEADLLTDMYIFSVIFSGL